MFNYDKLHCDIHISPNVNIMQKILIYLKEDFIFMKLSIIVLSAVFCSAGGGGACGRGVGLRWFSGAALRPAELQPGAHRTGPRSRRLVPGAADRWPRAEGPGEMLTITSHTHTSTLIPHTLVHRWLKCVCQDLGCVDPLERDELQEGVSVANEEAQRDRTSQWHLWNAILHQCRPVR